MKTIYCFILGFIEFRSNCGRTWEDALLTDAYDWGREYAHRITFRHWDC